MRVSCECIQGKLKINLYPEENEYEGKKARLSQTSCEFQLPTDWDLTKVGYSYYFDGISLCKENIRIAHRG